jgi:hypothetical protein
MPRVGFEPTIPPSKRANTVHALDHSVTVTGGAYPWIDKKRLENRDNNQRCLFVTAFDDKIMFHD